MRKAFKTRRHGWRRFASSSAAVLGVLGGALVATASVQAVTDAAAADPTSLGTTPALFGYSEYSSGDSSLGSPSGMSIAGTAVVGGDLNVPAGDTLTVGTAESNSKVLYVAGNLTGTGTLCVGGTNDIAEYIGTTTVSTLAGCDNVEQSTNLSSTAFQFIDSETSSISSNWAALGSNGTEQLSSGNLTLTGTGDALQVFNVPASDFANAQTLTINIPAGTTQVLINVVQTSPGPIGSGSLPLANIVYPNGSAIAANTWINFPTASSVTFAGLDTNANVLAPNGVVTLDGGQFDGYAYAASLDGNFTGQLPSATTIAGPPPSCPCTTTTTTTTSTTTTSSTTTTTAPTTTTTAPTTTTTSSTTTTTAPTTTTTAPTTTTTAPTTTTTAPTTTDHGADHHDHCADHHDHGADHHDHGADHHDHGADHHDHGADHHHFVDDNHDGSYHHDHGTDHHHFVDDNHDGSYHHDHGADHHHFVDDNHDGSYHHYDGTDHDDDRPDDYNNSAEHNYVVFDYNNDHGAEHDHLVDDDHYRAHDDHHRTDHYDNCGTDHDDDARFNHYAVDNVLDRPGIAVFEHHLHHGPNGGVPGDHNDSGNRGGERDYDHDRAPDNHDHCGHQGRWRDDDHYGRTSYVDDDSRSAYDDYDSGWQHDHDDGRADHADHHAYLIVAACLHRCGHNSASGLRPGSDPGRRRDSGS